MKIAVVIATYNGEKFLPAFLTSLQKQSRMPDTILFRDDGSCDRTLDIIQEFVVQEKRARLLPTTTRLGTIANFSELLSQVSQTKEYDLVFLADQDDLWHREKLAKMETWAKEEDASRPLLLHSDLRLIDENDQLIAPSFWNYAGLFPQRRTTLASLLMQNTITGAAVCVNRSLLEKALPIPSEALMHDHWLGLVAALFGKIIAMEEALVDYRQHGENQLGAKKYGFGYLWKKVSPIYIDIKQGRALLSRYSNDLGENQKASLEVFCSLPKSSFLGAKREVLRWGFYKQGFFRNLALLLFPLSERHRD